MTKESLHTELRTGLTTGTCASAVAKASVYMLIHQKVIEHVVVTMPDGSESTLEVLDTMYSKDSSGCMTIKDAGDDPDVTHGIKIYAKARFCNDNDIHITAGKGIGTVTKPGLAIEPGNPAINPVPLKMIRQAITEVLPPDTGIEIEISIPEGVEIAKKTYNPRLGIEGGISVLGTSGIVKPMSEEALKNTLELRIKQVAALGYDEIILIPGNYAASFLKTHFCINEDIIVQTSNFLGFMLEKAVLYNFKKILLAGHIGKFIKLAGGIFYTHSRIADARNEILASHYLLYSHDATTAKKLMEINTMEAAVELIPDRSFWDYIAGIIQEKSEQYIYNEIPVEVLTFSQNKGLLGKTKLSVISENPENSFYTKAPANSGQPVITICGMGPGNENMISDAVWKVVNTSEAIIGSSRHLEVFKNVKKQKIPFKGNLEKLKKDISSVSERNLAVLVSGDTGFYSLQKYICSHFQHLTIRMIPGISTYQYFYSRLNMSYEHAYLASLHGRSFNFFENLNKYETIFLLTDNKNNPSSIAKQLSLNNYRDIIMYIGINLSYPSEKIISGKAGELANSDSLTKELCSVILKSPHYCHERS